MTRNCCVAVVSLALLTHSAVSQAQTCTYSTGSAPRMTSWPTAISMPENSWTTFTASAEDYDTVTYTNGSVTTTYTVADSATCVWEAADGNAMSDTRGVSFTWQAPKLKADECSRDVKITISADDLPCPCAPCGGNRDDAPADPKTLTVTVYRVKDCDNNGDGVADDCRHCDNDKNSTYESCYACADQPGGNPKTRCADCDFNNDGVNEGCSTRITEYQDLVNCPNASVVQLPIDQNGCSVPGAIGGADPADKDNASNNPCGIVGNNGTSFQACCNQHDIDWCTCKKTLQDTNNAFRDCLNAVCNGLNNPACPNQARNIFGQLVNMNCSDYVNRYMLAVGVGLGWEGDQIAHCRCCVAGQ